MTKEQVLVWSGGMDSTCLLFDLLKEHDKLKIISFTNSKLSSGDEDSKARQQILKTLNKYHNGKFVYIERPLELMNHYQGSHWFTSLSMLIRKDSDVHMGYIRTDDFWHLKDNLESAFYAIQKMDGIDSKLIYDYEWMDKEQIIEKAKSIGIYNICHITKYIEENRGYVR